MRKEIERGWEGRERMGEERKEGRERERERERGSYHSKGEEQRKEGVRVGRREKKRRR